MAKKFSINPCLFDSDDYAQAGMIAIFNVKSTKRVSKSYLIKRAKFGMIDMKRSESFLIKHGYGQSNWLHKESPN